MDSARWQRIQELFHWVIDLPAAEREALLSEACGADEELRRSVVRMLEEDGRESAVLDGGVRGAAGGEWPPRRIGPWEIRHVLGEGGMGTVFYAVRADLGSAAAVKVLRDSWLSPARRDRFAREQYTLAQLDHPNIARLLDAGTLSSGTPYFVMEYVDGVHLDEYCDSRRCGIEERLRLFRQVCEAVQFAHGRAVIHRDLKPSNVMVKDGGTVRLLDFGIARQMDEFGPGADVTRTGLRMLTPAFASPEQIRGEPASVSADVYSLGVILYRLLTGRLPFEDLRGDAEAASPREAVRPSLVAPEALRAGSWQDLDVMCLKALHSDVAQRYGSAEALIRDVDHYLQGEPLDARPDTLTYRASKFVRRHAWGVGVSAAATVLFVAVSAAFLVRLAEERRVALTAAARTERTQRFLRNLFDGGDPDAGPSRDLRVTTLLDRGVLEARSLDHDPVIQAELYQNLGEIYQKLGDLGKADELFSAAMSKRRGVPGVEASAIVETTSATALLRLDQAKLDEAERLARDAVEMSRRSLPESHAVAVGSSEALGRVLVEKGKYDEAIAMLEAAAQRRAAARHTPAEEAGALYELANAYFYAGRYKEAEALNLRLLRVNAKIYGERHPRVAEVLVNLGAIQHDLGKYAEAEQYHRRALAITEAFFGETHYRTAAGLTLLGRALVFQQRYDEAVGLLRRALSIQERVFGMVHPRVASAVNELGIVALQRKDLKEARAQFTRLAAIYRSVYPGGHYLIGTATSNLGSAHLAGGDAARAEECFREAVGIFTRTQSATHINTGIARVKLGRALLRQKQYDRAEAEITAGSDILARQVNPSVTWLKAARADLEEIQSARLAAMTATR